MGKHHKLCQTLSNFGELTGRFVFVLAWQVWALEKCLRVTSTVSPSPPQASPELPCLADLEREVLDRVEKERKVPVSPGQQQQQQQQLQQNHFQRSNNQSGGGVGIVAGDAMVPLESYPGTSAEVAREEPPMPSPAQLRTTPMPDGDPDADADPDTDPPQSEDRTISVDTEKKAQILTMQALGITDQARVTVRRADPKARPVPQVRSWFDLAREGLPYVGVLRLVLLGMAVFVALILSWRTINRVTGLARTSASPELSQLQAQIASQAAARPDAIAAILRQWLTET